MLGLVVCGSRTWMWTMAAPALAASIGRLRDLRRRHRHGRVLAGRVGRPGDRAGDHDFALHLAPPGHGFGPHRSAPARIVDRLFGRDHAQRQEHREQTRRRSGAQARKFPHMMASIGRVDRHANGQRDDSSRRSRPDRVRIRPIEGRMPAGSAASRYRRARVFPRIFPGERLACHPVCTALSLRSPPPVERI